MFLGSIASSLGILFSPPGLSSVLDYMKPLAAWIVLFVEDHSPLRIVPVIREAKKEVTNSVSWSILGMIIGGVVKKKKKSNITNP